MKLFFSGGLQAKIELDQRIPKGVRHRLVSCHGAYISGGNRVITSILDTGNPIELMLDSGAFTAWTQGHIVELDDLIATYDTFLDNYADRTTATWLISLDRIPGEKGRTATAREIEEAVRISDINFAVLEKRYGQMVLPVFHQNESESRLKEVADMAPYICVSPRNDLGEGSRRKWSQEVHALIPGKKTHGLAATGYAMMTQVPWGSVDSATWVLLAANGTILFTESLRALQISDESGARKYRDQHFRSCSPAVQQMVREEVERRGFTVEGLEQDAFERTVYNRVVMMEFSAGDRPEKAILDIPLFQL